MRPVSFKSNNRECQHASLRDWVIAQASVRLGRLDCFPAMKATRRILLSSLAGTRPAVRFNTLYGFQILLPAWDPDILICAANGRILHPWITEVFRTVIRPGFTVVDGGANVGFYSLLAATLMQGRGLVLSFEPDVRNVSLLGANIELNGLTRIVKVEAKAHGDVDGECDFWMSLDNSWAGTLVKEQTLHYSPTKTVVTTLDHYLRAAGIPTVDVVKLDIEGAEPLALKGMCETLAKASLLVYEVHRQRQLELGIDPVELIRRSVEAGLFTFCLIADERKDEICKFDVGRCKEILDASGWADVLCAKGEVAAVLAAKFGDMN